VTVAIEIAFALGVTILLIALGVPIVYALGILNILLLETTGALPTALFGDALFGHITVFALIAIPLFILTGDIIVMSGLSAKLMEFADSLVGGFKTGVGSATVLGCGLFASISGSNAADAAAIGRITYGELKEIGYPGSYACALVASGSTTGILIPPSIAYIIIGVALGISAAKLFLAAFIPGILVLLGVLLTNIAMNNVKGFEQGHEFGSPRQIAEATWEAKAALTVPVVILGGIYSGVFTPTESAAAAVAVTLVIAGFTRRITLGDYSTMFIRSAVVNGVLVPIIGMAVTLGGIFAALGFGETLASFITDTTSNYYYVIFLMFVIFIVAGALMETTPNILILGPLLLPIAESIGMNPVHFAVFMNTALGVGFITPPIGVNLYVMAGVTDEPLIDIAGDAIPYVAVLSIITLLVGFYPPFSMIFIN